MQATTFITRHLDFRHPGHEGTNELFSTYWPAYKSWFSSKLSNAGHPQRIREGKKQLAKHMPEFLPVYERLCALTNNCPIAVDFITGYQPPAYLVSCSQAVVNWPQPTLIRNYDLSPNLSENVISQVDLMGRKVIGTNECLWGLDDGMNDAGLTASLTFGGSKQVGQGFGIPFIMRYMLHSCSTVKQAIEVLKRIPSHMTYNVTLLDKKGNYATVFIAPDQMPVVTRERCATNHQQQVVWPEQATFSKTVERKQHLERELGQTKMNDEDLLHLFLAKPLHSDNYEQQFGTVFTAMYQPVDGTMAYHWPNQSPLVLSFALFTEQDRVVQLDGQSVGACKYGYQLQANDSYNPADWKISDAVSTGASNNIYDNASHSATYIPNRLRGVLLKPLSYIPGVRKQVLPAQKSLSWRDYGQLYVEVA